MSLLTIPDAVVSTVTGIYDVLTCFPELSSIDPDVPSEMPFNVELIGVGTGTRSPAGLTLLDHRSYEDVEHTDLIIAPALMLPGSRWTAGRYPGLVRWLSDAYEDGAILSSACSGVLLLAETGLLDGLEATVHWAYVRTFRENFPQVRLRQEKVLVASGEKQRLIMSGASASWHDLVLYLVARTVDPAAAQAIAKFMMLQWHVDGQSAYEMFQPIRDHGDAAVLESQDWIDGHYTSQSPVEQMTRVAGLPERTFKRRFKLATGFTPGTYVQQIRVEAAKRRLERTQDPVERIGWDVGYADEASFRRTFKRVVGLSPAAYRKKFLIPDFARPPAPTRA